MKLCPQCNNQMEDSASFCPYCGTQTVEAPEESIARAKAFYTFRRNLRHERKCWKIFGGVWLGFTIFYAAFITLFALIAIAAGEMEMVAYALLYSMHLGVYLPFAIINMVMANKASRYLDNLETDPNPAVDRCGGVWLIVLSAIFNNLAMIFVILNFVHVKTNGHLLKQ